MNINGESKPDWLDTNAVLNAILKAVLSLLSQNNELAEQKKQVKDLQEKNRAQAAKQISLKKYNSAVSKVV